MTTHRHRAFLVRPNPINPFGGFSVDQNRAGDPVAATGERSAVVARGLWGLNRVSPCSPTPDDNIASDTVARGLIVPIALPWPYTVDAGGVAFPAGLVGVLSRSEKPEGGFIRRLIPVPSTLPGGYTVRRRRDHNCAGRYNQFRDVVGDILFGVGGSLRYHRANDGGGVPDGSLRTSEFGAFDGCYLPPECDHLGHLSVRDPGQPLRRYRWWPQADDDTVDQQTTIAVGDGFSPNTPVAIAIGFPIDTTGDSLSPGWRQISILNAAGAAGSTTTIRLRAAIDGDFGNLATVATFTISSGTPSTTLLGSCPSPTLGKFCAWFWEFDGSAPRKATSFEAVFHPRVDIPMPFFTTGIDDAGNHLKAPGGIVAGALPGY